MKLLTLLALLIAPTAFAAKTMPYAVPLADLNAIALGRIVRPMAVIQGLALVDLTEAQVGQLSAQLHGAKHACGGFVSLEPSLVTRGSTPLQALARAAAGPAPAKGFDLTQPAYPAAVGIALAKLKGARYRAALEKLVSFPDRSANTVHGEEAAKWLATQAGPAVRGLGRPDATVQVIPTGTSYRQPSVVIRFPGADSSLPAALMGGHMDTFENKPGADDDGSGTATVLEVMYAIAESGLRFKRDLYFAFYAAEERGLVGSGFVVKKFVADKVAIRGALQFDMTAFKSPADTKDIYLVTDHVDAAMTTFLTKLATAYAGIPADRIGATKCGYACSDHARWNDAGIPAAFPFESSFQNYNKAIHTARDTISLLDFLHAEKYAKLGVAFAVEAAEPVSRRR